MSSPTLCSSGPDSRFLAKGGGETLRAGPALVVFSAQTSARQRCEHLNKLDLSCIRYKGETASPEEEAAALKMACLLDEHCYVIFSWKEREAFTTQVETPTRRLPELHLLSCLLFQESRGLGCPVSRTHLPAVCTWRDGVEQ
ncbi:uncharacterized protein RBU33_010601 isoform 2-T2 [Hipposideros larvatus]